MITQIISGGQTGVDRAALDVAIKLDIPHGGWCPKGRAAELGGIIPHRYHMQETDSEDVNVRTKLNIRDSDGTLIFVPELPLKVTDGTVLTIKEVVEQKKPHFIFNLSDPASNEKISMWVKQENIKILNVAGPRESQHPGIYLQVLSLLENTLSFLNQEPILKQEKHLPQQIVNRL